MKTLSIQFKRALLASLFLPLLISCGFEDIGCDPPIHEDQNTIVLQADYFEIEANKPALLDVFQNDIINSFNGYEIKITETPEHGRIVLQAGSVQGFLYFPEPGFEGFDTFTYMVCSTEEGEDEDHEDCDDEGDHEDDDNDHEGDNEDDHGNDCTHEGNCETAVVTIVVGDPNNTNDSICTPFAMDDMFVIDENNKAICPILINDIVCFPFEVEVSQPLHGNARFDYSTGLVTYIANDASVSEDHFLYSIRNANGVHTEGKVKIVRFPNANNPCDSIPFMLSDDTFSFDDDILDSTSVIILPVMMNDSFCPLKVDSNTLSITLAPENGTAHWVQLQSMHWAIEYIPNETFRRNGGTETIEYEVCSQTVLDGNVSNTCKKAFVTIHIE